jgi:hypothetical protein
MPNVSTSTGRLYYLDGDTDVRYLAPDGSAGLATKLPGNSQAVAMFAVSPDDRRIAVSVFDYRSKPVATRLYVEDLAGGSNRIYLPALGAGLYRWPVGWHAGHLIMGLYSNPIPFLDAAPLPEQIESLQVLDPTSGRILAVLGDPSCAPVPSLPTQAGVACASKAADLGVGIIDWSGIVTIFSRAGYSDLSISPDGRYILAEAPAGGGMTLISSPATGSVIRDLGEGGYPYGGGWLDSSHVVVYRPGSSDLAVVDIQDESMTPLTAFTFPTPGQTPPPPMLLVGALPGGF